MKISIRTWAMLAVALAVAACSGNGGGSQQPAPQPPAANAPPVANAGPDQVVSPGAAVSVTGASSSDADGTIASYAWTQTAGSTVSLAAASSVTPGFTAPS